jgi:hypothetical protein
MKNSANNIEATFALLTIDAIRKELTEDQLEKFSSILDRIYQSDYDFRNIPYEDMFNAAIATIEEYLQGEGL